jgi:hypothetical protein
MKLNYKISGRERWVIAFAPTVLIVGTYLMGYVDSLSAALEKAQKRATAAMAPLPPPTPSATLLQARTARDAAKKDIATRQAHIDQLEDQLATLSQNAATLADDRDAARVIERVEAIFARNGITPLISEAAGEGGNTDRMPSALLAVLAPKIDASGNQKGPRVWHCIFNDLTPNFERSLREVTNEIPSVLPLSFNLVYNPANDGETRLLELWLLY